MALTLPSFTESKFVTYRAKCFLLTWVVGAVHARFKTAQTDSMLVCATPSLVTVLACGVVHGFMVEALRPHARIAAVRVRVDRGGRDDSLLDLTGQAGGSVLAIVSHGAPVRSRIPSTLSYAHSLTDAEFL